LLDRHLWKQGIHQEALFVVIVIKQFVDD